MNCKKLLLVGFSLYQSELSVVLILLYQIVLELSMGIDIIKLQYVANISFLKVIAKYC